MSNQKKSEIKKKSIIVESLGFSTEEPQNTEAGDNPLFKIADYMLK